MIAQVRADLDAENDSLEDPAKLEVQPPNGAVAFSVESVDIS